MGAGLRNPTQERSLVHSCCNKPNNNLTILQETMELCAEDIKKHKPALFCNIKVKHHHLTVVNIIGLYMHYWRSLTFLIIVILLLKLC